MQIGVFRQVGRKPPLSPAPPAPLPLRHHPHRVNLVTMHGESDESKNAKPSFRPGQSVQDKTGWSKIWISPYFKIFIGSVHVDKTNEK